MANLKISDYVDVDSLDGTEVFLVSKSGVYRKTTLEEIRNLAADITNTALAELVGKAANAHDVKNILNTINTNLENQANSINSINSSLSDMAINVKSLGYLAYGDGIHDDTTAIQNALNYLIEKGGGTLFFPTGTYKIVSTTFYVNCTGTIFIEGQGESSILSLYDYSDKFLFVANEKSDGTKFSEFPGFKKIYAKNIYVDGYNSISAKFLKENETGAHLENITFTNMYYGIINDGYSDGITLKRLSWLSPKLNGWLAYFMGGQYMCDNFYAEQLFGMSVNMVRLALCGGAIFNNCNGGYYQFDLSDGIQFNASHLEFTADSPAIKISNSQITIKRNRFHNNNRKQGSTLSTGYSPITITDSLSSSNASNIVLEDNLFIRSMGRGWETNRPADINIDSLYSTSKIYLKNNVSRLFNTEKNYIDFGLKVSANINSLASLNDTLQKNMNLLSGSCFIERANGTWRVYGAESKFILPIAELLAPTLTGAEDTSVGNTLATGNYYYKAVAYTLNGRHSEASTELSISKTGGIESSINIQASVTGKCYLFLYRGTTSGSYDKVVIIPLINDISTLIDTGDNLSGYPWVTVGSTIPSASIPVGTNSTGNGTINLLTGAVNIEKDSLPTSSSFQSFADDSITIKNTGTGQPYKYKCTLGGTPGNFRLLEQTGIIKNTTANRPTLTISDTGLIFIDTTLATNGKPIMWNGTAWVDYTGTIV